MYALIRALDLNVKTCFLEASNAGLNLYRRIGFQPLFANHYLNPYPKYLELRMEH
jgi:ribosomal protein S18 acetylase RimI-like enzyme